MFSKKIILLISLLLILCSSYIIIFRHIKNNNKVNLINNLDNSINREELINKDNKNNIKDIHTKKSNLKYLIFFVIIIIVVIIIAVLLKNIKTDNPIINIDKIEFLKKYNEFTKENIEIGVNKKKEGVKDVVKVLDKHAIFLKKNKNKIKVDDNKIKELVKNIFKYLENEYKEYMRNHNIKAEDYSPNKYLIDFRNLFEKNDINKSPRDSDGKLFRRVNRLEHDYIIREIFIYLFNMVNDKEEFSDHNFDNKNNNEKEDLVFFFITCVIKPFFSYLGKEVENIIVLFSWLEFGDITELEHYFFSMSQEILEKNNEKIGNIKKAFVYILNHHDFILMFDTLLFNIFC